MVIDSKRMMGEQRSRHDDCSEAEPGKSSSYETHHYFLPFLYRMRIAHRVAIRYSEECVKTRANNMLKTISLASIVVLLLSLSSCNRTQQQETQYVPGLGEIMTLNQMRHVKLWYAGQNANWALASYELDELNEGLDDAAKFHPTHKD